MRCSYLLVNKEYAKEILSEAYEQKTSGNTKLISACMNLLTVTQFSESLFFNGTYWPCCILDELLFCLYYWHKSTEQFQELLVCMSKRTISFRGYLLNV